MPQTKDYHFHVYYEDGSKLNAQAVIEKFCEKFSLTPGNFHDKPVGPHPVGSCQVTVSLNQLGEAMDWMAINRQELAIFIHANTGDVMKDHSDHTIWMGQMMKLNMDILHRFVAANKT